MKETFTVLTGLQPSGGIQLGNYLGAIRSWVAMQDSCRCLFFLPDMHAITVPQDPEDLRRNTLDGVALYLACGIDPEKAAVFVQSQVIGHSELAWVLGCHTPIGQLERMTQFKDKSTRPGTFIGAGLLYYPVLMAADILLYNADLVPVGDDQKQHVELARDLAERFNSSRGHTFTIPRPHIPKGCARVMSLQDPSAKMSKSDGNGLATVFLTDGDEQIRRKFRSAVTDSGREICLREDKPGIRNLLEIFSALANIPESALVERYASATYGKFKDDLADAAIAVLGPIREKFFQLREDRRKLLQVLECGRKEAQECANVMLQLVYEKIGFLPATNR